MAHYGNRSRGRGGRGGGSRPGLLGTAPRAIPGLLDTQYDPPHYDRESRSNQGLLGNAPDVYSDQNYGGHEEEQYHQSYESDYSYQEQEQYGTRGYNERSQEDEGMGVNRSPSQILHSLQMHGVSKSELEELTSLPQKDVSKNDLLRLIQNVQNRRSLSQQSHDHGGHSSQQGHSMRSFSPRKRSPDRNALYDPSEPTDDYGTAESYNKPLFGTEDRQTEAFSSFEEKWYSESSKKNERDSQAGGSILRGSRGAVAKPSHWDRNDQPPPVKQTRRPSPPPMRAPPPRRPSPMQQRHPSPSPVRRPSPRRMSPPPRRMTPPPLMQGQMRRLGSLLGTPPCEPPMQEHDMRGGPMRESTMRPPQQNTYRPERGFTEPDRFHEPMRRSPQPPPRPLIHEEPVLHAQMKAMQFLKSEVGHRSGPPPLMGPRETRGKGIKKTTFTKEEAAAEATKMRNAEGRVLYLRYQAGSMGAIREEHLVKLAQPFDKVTNILLVAPKNLKNGWYQAFVELAHFDGAAAMCEHYMFRPPTVEGITMQVQRSKHQNLQLREHQMNRDIDRLVQNQQRFAGKKRRASASPERSRKNQKDNDRGKKAQEKGKKESATKGAPKGNKKPVNKSKGGPPAKVADKKSPKDANAKSAATKKENNAKIESVQTDDAESPRKDAKEESVEKVKNGEKIKTAENGEKAKTGDEVENGEKVKTGENGEKVKTAENGEKVETGQDAEVVVEKSKDKIPDFKTEKNVERLHIIGENLEQAITMMEALLKTVEEEPTQAVISEVLEYLGDSVDQLKQIEQK